MNASTSPSTKTGVEMPMLAMTMVPTSVLELRRMADRMPSGMPTPMAKSNAKTVSSMVVGRRCTMRSVTGSWNWIESPRSPDASCWT